MRLGRFGADRKSMRDNFWLRKRVLITGHTGFKGAWLSLILERLGAQTLGVALKPTEAPNLFDSLGSWQSLSSVFADISIKGLWQEKILNFDPEIVIHLAAQPIVSVSYSDPVNTFATNVFGTINVLQTLREAKNVRVVLVVTSDKVYRNTDTGEPFDENACLGGDDPYSASKACAEMVANCWYKTFFADQNIAVATARGGNVIGGGDFSKDRIIPDIYRSLVAEKKLILRNPKSTRPWQHVLDVSDGYLTYIQHLWSNAPSTPKALNFGPSDMTPVTVNEIYQMMAEGMDMNIPTEQAKGWFQEKDLLAVETSLAASEIGWMPKMSTSDAVSKTAHWYKSFIHGADARDLSTSQIEEHWIAQ